MADKAVAMGRTLEQVSRFPGDLPRQPMVKVVDLGDGTYALAITAAELAGIVQRQNEIHALLVSIDAKLTAGITVNTTGGGL